MTPLLAALSLGVILFGGWGLSCLLQPRCPSLAGRAAQAWLLGAIGLSATLCILGNFLSGKALLAAVTTVAVAAGLAALRRNPAPATPSRSPLPQGWAEWALCTVLLIQLLILLRVAWNTALGWDAAIIWEPKARAAFANGGAIPAAYFTDSTRSWAHLDYPLMLPMLETWVYLWAGESSQALVRVIFPFFYLAALLLIISGVAEVTGRRWPGLLTATLLFFIPFLTTGYYNVFNGYADFPLAVLYLAAILSLLGYTRDAVPSHALAFAIYAAALPWMKHEGALLWCCILPVALYEILRRGQLRLAMLTALPGLAVIAAWKIAMAAIKTPPNPDFLPFSIATAFNNAGRLGFIAHTLLNQLASVPDWSLLWFLFPAALVIIAASGQRRLSLHIAAFVIVPLTLYSSVYLLSQVDPYQMHVITSLPRLISQVAPVALLSLGVALSSAAGKPTRPTPAAQPISSSPAPRSAPASAVLVG